MRVSLAEMARREASTRVDAAQISYAEVRAADRTDWQLVDVKETFGRHVFDRQRVRVRGELRDRDSHIVVVAHDGRRCALSMHYRRNKVDHLIRVELEGVDASDVEHRDERAAYAIREMLFVLRGSYPDDCEPVPRFIAQDADGTLPPFLTLERIVGRR